MGSELERRIGRLEAEVPTKGKEELPEITDEEWRECEAHFHEALDILEREEPGRYGGERPALCKEDAREVRALERRENAKGGGRGDGTRTESGG